MTGVEHTIALMIYFLNNCRFDKDGKSSCSDQRQNDRR